ncbi:Polyadenylate-binding protein 1 [Mycena kentingensis (nom. inval.)]|nr:Polyadenylate-binding protein 1 [Mycena kentingensis (nom. inval.)]
MYSKPHPHITTPTLFLDSVHARISEEDIKQALVDYPGVSLKLIKPKRRRNFHRVDFEDLASAEKALAVLGAHPLPGIQPARSLELSFKPPRPQNSPTDNLKATAYPRLVKSWGTARPAQDLFGALRGYGPIAGVYVDDIVGGLVQFWAEEDARAAQDGAVGPTGKRLHLVPYDPCSVFCSNIHFDIDATTLRSYFEKFGTITSAEILYNPRTQKSRGLGVISFLNASQAIAAIRGMHGCELNWRKISVSYRTLKPDEATIPGSLTNSETNSWETAASTSEPAKAPKIVPVSTKCPSCADLSALRLLCDEVKHRLATQAEAGRLRAEIHEAERVTHQARLDEEAKQRVAALAERDRVRDELDQTRSTHEQEMAERAMDYKRLLARVNAEIKLRASLETKNDDLRQQLDALKRVKETENADRVQGLPKLKALYEDEVKQRIAAEKLRDRLRNALDASTRAEESEAAKSAILGARLAEAVKNRVAADAKAEKLARKIEELKRARQDDGVKARKEADARVASFERELLGLMRARELDAKSHVKIVAELQGERDREIKQRELLQTVRDGLRAQLEAVRHNHAADVAEHAKEKENMQTRLDDQKAAMFVQAKWLKGQLATMERARDVAESKLKMFELDEGRSMRQEQQRKKAEEVRRQQEEMARKKKMEEMAEQEHQRQEKLRQQRKEQARAERERMAREQEERDRRDAEENTERQRMQQYRKAAKKEDKRLRKRDETTFGARTAAWTKTRAVLRFKILAPVFEAETFSETKPLTMRAVPWPVLTDPSDLCVEDITWAQVEQFFAYYQQMEGVEPAEYRELVKKAHQFFHPDRWRSRAILATILDEDVRLALEAAGNVVAQALTPVWMASRQYK